jgi:hypothetical protein
LAALFAATAVPLLAPAAPVPKHLMKDPVYYYPIRVGATWVYEDPNGSEETLTISKVELADGARVVTVDRVDPNGLVLWERMAVSAGGLVRVEGLGGKLDPPLAMLQGPFRAGTKWETKTSGLDGVDTIGGIERVKVPAGTYEAVRVDADYSIGGGGARTQTTFWYAAGVGLVRRTDGNAETFRVLKSFTPGKP